MDAFSVLRQQAAAKRDEAVSAARLAYRKQTRLIDQLQAELGRERPARPRRKGCKSIIALAAELMPQDRPFTVQDIVALMQQAEPQRVFNLGSIRAEFSKMIDRGLIRRVRRMEGGQLLWAAAGCEVDQSPLTALPLPGAISEVLGERGPLAVAEIVVALKEAGYRPEADPRILLRSVREVFNRGGGRFERQEGGKWSVIPVTC